MPLNVTICVCDVTATLTVVTSPMNFNAVSNHGNYIAFVSCALMFVLSFFGTRLWLTHSFVRWLVGSSVHLVVVFAYQFARFV